MAKINLEAFTLIRNKGFCDASAPCRACCFDKYSCSSLFDTCYDTVFYTADTDEAKVIMARLKLGVHTDGE